MKLFGRGTLGVGFLFALVLLAGCASGGKTATDNNNLYTFDPTVGSTNVPIVNSGLPGADTSGSAPAPAPGPGVSDPEGTILHIKRGDTLSVHFGDIPTEMKDVTDQVHEDGTITLLYSQRFVAEGKTLGQLRDEIHARYVPKFFVRMTPSVTTAEGFFSVGGEVKAGNRYVWTPGMTVLRAIDAAGGFNDFARKGYVTITRANTRKQEHEDCIKALKNPDLDLPIYPGDTIYVKKRPL